MSEDSQNELNTYIVPLNIVQSNRVLGFRIRNLAEGGVFAGIVALIIHFIPFVTKIQVIFTIVLSSSVFFVCAIGFKGMSLGEIVINRMISKGTKHIYHLRSIRYARKQSERQAAGNQQIYFNESIAEKGFRKAKAFVRTALGKDR